MDSERETFTRKCPNCRTALGPNESHYSGSPTFGYQCEAETQMLGAPASSPERARETPDPNEEPEALLLVADVREAIANLAYRVALDSLGAGLDRALEVQQEWRDVLRNPPHWTDRGQAALIVALEIKNALRAENARAKELMAMQVQFGTEMQERADRLERALVEVANMARGDGASRDPFGTLDRILSVAWKTIDGPLASPEARAAARSTGERTP